MVPKVGVWVRWRTLPGSMTGVHAVAEKMSEELENKNVHQLNVIAKALNIRVFRRICGRNSSKELGSGSTGGFSLPPSPSPRPVG